MRGFHSRGAAWIGGTLAAALLAGCGAAAGATPPAAGTTSHKTTAAPGGTVFVKLPFNRQAFASGPTKEPASCKAYDPKPTVDHCVPYFDLTGGALPTKGAPTKPVTVPLVGGGKATFQFPSVKGKNAVSLAPMVKTTKVAFKVKPGKYKQLDVLTAAGNGPAPLEFKFQYKGGGTTTQALSVPDWFKNSPPFSLPFAGRWENPAASKAFQSAKLGLYAFPLKLNSAKTLTGVSVTAASPATSQADANLLAATLVS